MNPRQIKAIVFDLDGTLVDSMTGFAHVAAEVMEYFFGMERGLAHREYLRTSGLPFPEQLKSIFPGNSLIYQANASFDSRKRDSYDVLPFYRDAHSALELLRNKGIKLAISSNNDQELVDIKIRDLAVTFDCVMGFKPGFLKGKAHFDLICDRLNLSANEMLFVGDSLHDAVVARENGISFIAKAGTFSQTDFLKQGIAAHIINNLTELLTLLNDSAELMNAPLKSTPLKNAIPLTFGEIY